MLNRTQLVDATIATVATNLGEGALLVILVLFVLLGNFRAALITALVIPLAMLMTATGMLQGRISANLMSLGALDFGLIVDGAVIITENSLAAPRRKAGELPAARCRTPSDCRRCRTAAEEMIGPSVYGQAIIILVYVPLLTFSGVEGKMFEPMALTVILALVAAFVLSLTFVPALIAIFVTGRVSEGDNAAVRRLKVAYRAAAARARSRVRSPAIAGAVVLFAVALLLFLRLGQEFIPTLDEKNICHARAADSRAPALPRPRRCSSTSRKRSAACPQVAFVFSKTGTAEIATDPMPPNASDTFIILKPRKRWPDPDADQGGVWSSRSKRGRASCPATIYEFTQPIQMRFNELLAGVRGDIAVKVFGDEFEPLLRAANQIAAILRGDQGRHRRQGRAAERPSGARDQRRQGGDRPARPQPRGGAGRDRHRHRRPGSRRGVRGRPPFRDRGAAAGQRSATTSTRSRTCRSRLPTAARNAPQTVPLGQLAAFRLRRRARTRSAARTASGAWW